MLNIETKAARYDVIEAGIINRIETIRKNLAYDLECSINYIPLNLWEHALLEHIYQYANNLFSTHESAFHVIDLIVSENAPHQRH